MVATAWSSNSRTFMHFCFTVCMHTRTMKLLHATQQWIGHTCVQASQLEDLVEAGGQRVEQLEQALASSEARLQQAQQEARRTQQEAQQAQRALQQATQEASVAIAVMLPVLG
eukprot:1160477-Pelagomonas_calceolata.AAC.3